MARYSGAKLRITRRLGDLPGLTSKVKKRTNRPGQQSCLVTKLPRCLPNDHNTRRVAH